MRRLNIVGKALLQVAALGLFLNAVTAYGACDMKMHDSKSSTEERMPCHGVTEKTPPEPATADIDSEDCCSACVPVGIFSSEEGAEQLAANAVDVGTTRIQPSSGFDPPFRPPIADLS